MMESEGGKKEVLSIFYVSGGPEGWPTAWGGGGGPSLIGTLPPFLKESSPTSPFSTFNVQGD